MTQDTLDLIQTRFQSLVHHFPSPTMSDYYVGLFHGVLDVLSYSLLIDNDEYDEWWEKSLHFSSW